MKKSFFFAALVAAANLLMLNAPIANAAVHVFRR
jgi:hypothetical protein